MVKLVMALGAEGNELPGALSFGFFHFVLFFVHIG